ncbi:MAG: hypothetical protein ACI8QZ_000739 [Chlamydiales bacterium]|jgi:hypothetical protein
MPRFLAHSLCRLLEVVLVLGTIAIATLAHNSFA